jgi:hypothetical protein
VVRSSCLSGSRLFDSPAGMDFHRRALRDECRRRLTRKYPREIYSIEFRGIAIKAGAGAWTDAPWFAGHLVFERAAAALSGLTPVVLRNKLFRAAARRLNGKAYTLRVDSIPFSIQTPCIFSCDVRAACFDAMPHGKSGILLVVEHASNLRYGKSWNDFTDKGHASPQSASLAAWNLRFHFACCLVPSHAPALPH